jgi:hypothetical protein
MLSCKYLHSMVEFNFCRCHTSFLKVDYSRSNSNALYNFCHVSSVVFIYCLFYCSIYILWHFIIHVSISIKRLNNCDDSLVLLSDLQDVREKQLLIPSLTIDLSLRTRMNFLNWWVICYEWGISWYCYKCFTPNKNLQIPCNQTQLILTNIQ